MSSIEDWDKSKNDYFREKDEQAELSRLERENAELREAIFGGADYDTTVLKHGNFVAMARDCEAGRKGAIQRAETAERQLAEAKAELAQMWAQVAELLMALENAARMAEQGALSTDEAFAAAEIRSLVPESARAALGSGDGGWPVPEGYALVPVDEWRSAYAAFCGAFDTPLARRKQDDEYAADARKRLRDLNDRLPAAPAVEVAK